MGTIYNVSEATLITVFFLSCVLLAVLVHKVMRDEGNNLEWWHFISTRAQNGQNYADIDKLGKVVGIFVSSWYIVKLGADGRPDAAVLGVYLAFVGGVAGYSAYLRSQRGTVTESTHTETTSTSTEKAKESPKGE